MVGSDRTARQGENHPHHALADGKDRAPVRPLHRRTRSGTAEGTGRAARPRPGRHLRRRGRPLRLSTRTSGWYRVAVVGTTPDEARKKVAGLRKMYKPHIALEHEHGQFLLLREFIPGQPLASKRHMDVEAVAAGMATAGDRIGDRRGVVLGETSSIAPRPVIWDLFAAHEIKHKSGLTLIVAVPGSGKTFLAGMIVYQAVRAGAYGVVLDPSGPLKEPANLPEFRDIARVYALTGRDSRPGAARLRGCAANQYSVDSVVTVGRTCGCGDYRRR